MLRTGERDHLTAEIAIVLAVKLAALALIWWLFFSPPHRVIADPDATAGHLLGQRPASPAHQTQEPS